MKWSVGAKIAAGFAFALIMLAIIGIISLRSTLLLINTNEQVTQSYKILGELNNILSSLKDAETGQRGFIITGRASYLDPYLEASEDVKKNINALRLLLADNQSQLQQLSSLESLINKKFLELQETIEVRKNDANGFETARQIVLTDKGKIAMDEIRNLMNQMENEENHLLLQRSNEAQSSAKMGITIIILGTILTVLALIAITLLLTRNIAEPLKEISNIAEKISTGDLSAKLLLDNRKDEVGMLGETFIHMTKSLKGMADVAAKIAEGDLRVNVNPQSNQDILGNAFVAMLENLRHVTKEIAEGIRILEFAVKEIISSTAQLTLNANQTAAAVNETTAAFEEMRHTSQIFNQKAKQVSDGADKAKQTSRSGVQSAENVAIGMDRIQQQTEAIFASMNKLSEQSQSIEKIIESVEGLASQSHLLSVNAAIEASIAGEHGKGFNVIAQEMRRLNEQSQLATKQVRTILSDIQKAIDAAVKATLEGRKVINEGIKQTEIAGNSIQALAQSVEEAVEASTQIEISTEQQLLGVEQMATAMNSIREAIDKNVSNAKLLESSGKNLNEMGNQLKKMVNSYKL